MTYTILLSILLCNSSRVFIFFMLMKNHPLYLKYAIFKPLYRNNNLSPENKNSIFRSSIFQSTCGLILRVVSHLFVVIIKCRFDFPMVAMGELDPRGEPHPRKLRYADSICRAERDFHSQGWKRSSRL